VELNTEIEKVSLFTLKRQRELAEGVGALRFDELLPVAKTDKATTDI
jgi:hypothetical protein